MIEVEGSFLWSLRQRRRRNSRTTRLPRRTKKARPPRTGPKILPIEGELEAESLVAIDVGVEVMKAVTVLSIPLAPVVVVIVRDILTELMTEGASADGDVDMAWSDEVVKLDGSAEIFSVVILLNIASVQVT